MVADIFTHPCPTHTHIHTHTYTHTHTHTHTYTLRKLSSTPSLVIYFDSSIKQLLEQIVHLTTNLKTFSKYKHFISTLETLGKNYRSD